MEITLQEQITIARKRANMTITELAKNFGTSQSNFTQRLNNGKFTKEELERIASILNCKYVSYFQTLDGSKIE